MNQNDRLEFAKQILLLGEVFGEPVSDMRAQAYFDALYDLDLAAIQAATKHLIRESRFFPRPIDIRGAIQGTPDELADAAWGEREKHSAILKQLGVDGYNCRTMAATELMRLREPFRAIFKRQLASKRMANLLAEPERKLKAIT